MLLFLLGSPFMAGALVLYFGLTASADHATKAYYDEMIKQLNESVQDRIDQAVSEHTREVEDDITRLRNLYLTLGNDLDSMKNISLLDFAILVETIQANFTIVSIRIEEVERQASSTNAELAILEQNGEKLAGNVTLLEEAKENMEAQLINLAAESSRNATFFTSSLANISTDLTQLELETSRNFTFLNTSLQHEVQDLSETLAVNRAEAHGLINRSVAGVLVRIEHEVSEIRSHIDSQVSEVRGHVDSQDSELRNHIDTQVSEVRNHADAQNSEIRRRITSAVGEERSHTDSEISAVRGYIATEIGNVKQSFNTRLQSLQNGAGTLKSSGLLAAAFLLMHVLHYL